MLNRNKIIMKASFLQLRIYLLFFLGVAGVSIASQIIVNLSLKENTLVSIGNMLTPFLIIIAIVLPTSFFKRVINLGATRKEYYISVLAIYAIWAAGYSVFNIIWFKLENIFLVDYLTLLNILEVFHWDQFSVIGMFFYQFGTYMMIISLFNLLFSGLMNFVNWIIWAVLIVAIPIGVSIPSYRVQVADAFQTLLFNDSLFQGVGLTFIFSCTFLTCGWFFIRKRTI